MIDQDSAAVELHFGLLDTIDCSKSSLDLADAAWAAEILGAKCGGFDVWSSHNLPPVKELRGVSPRLYIQDAYSESAIE